MRPTISPPPENNYDTYEREEWPGVIWLRPLAVDVPVCVDCGGDPLHAHKHNTH